MAVRIVTDSASSLSEHELAEHALAAVDLHVLIEGQELSAQELGDPGFYERLAGLSEPPTTSQPSPEEFADVFRTAAEQGHDVLAVLISAGMSGTVHSAELAATAVSAEYPEARIEVLDSRSNSMEEGFAVLSAAEVASRGGSIEECRVAVQATM
jgi:DegV family protein with EDD domain